MSGEPGPFDSLVRQVVTFCCRSAALVVTLSGFLAVLTLAYTVEHFSIDTDSSKLISADLPWRQQEMRFDADFPQSVDQTVVVIDAATPEVAERAADVLSRRLSVRTDLFRTVRRP